MHSISIQIQPERATGMDMGEVSRAFEAIVGQGDLVRHHKFERGEDKGPYYNFTFGTSAPSLLWRVIWNSLFESPVFGDKLKATSMAMCSAQDGWDKYIQLFHYDSQVPCGSV